MEPEKETILTFSLEDTIMFMITVKNNIFLLRSQIKYFKYDARKIKFECSPHDTLNIQKIEKSESGIEKLELVLEIKERFYKLMKTKISNQGIDIDKETENYVKEK